MSRPAKRRRPGSLKVSGTHASLNRVALVTGANRGLGLATCRAFLDRGLRVIMTGRDEDALHRAHRQLGRPEHAITVRLDVDEPGTIEEARRVADARFGAVDVVVNNAAVLLHENDDLLSIPLEAFRQSLQTNLLGAIEVSRVFVPPMAARHYGRVVNVSSGAGQLAHMSTYAPAYSISKAALNAFTRILAATYGDDGVLVNCVDPGWVRTDMGGSSAPRSPEEGVDTTVWLATLPDDGPTGQFFHDRKRVAW